MIGRVEVEGVWKKFHYGEVHTRLQDAVPALLGKALGRRPANDALWAGEFWALRDVSFAVGPGEALGLIGSNGAGKSTVLKLLIGTLRPTLGRCTLTGRVGAVIEVAAGFHPDLTGRENVYLQGVIMGMPRREIALKFDRIVDFSEVGRFIDTPVKRYSSGMQARLGFAVAAHLEPEVLVVDEVLAIGDASFQAKAFARVKTLVDRGIPVVVVSHQLDIITALCTRALLLERGSVAHDGTPRECIAAYLHGRTDDVTAVTADTAIRLDALDLPESVVSGEMLTLRVAGAASDEGGSDDERLKIRVRFAQTGDTAFETTTDLHGAPLPARGGFRVTATLQMNLAPGVYRVETAIWTSDCTRELATGPASYVEVTTGLPFEGPTQLNPRIVVEPAG